MHMMSINLHEIFTCFVSLIPLIGFRFLFSPIVSAIVSSYAELWTPATALPLHSPFDAFAIFSKSFDHLIAALLLHAMDGPPGTVFSAECWGK